jgi:tRNA modification GTPase
MGELIFAPRTIAAMHSDLDPIVAISTPPGRGAIGIVRISGSAIGPIAAGLLGDRTAASLAPRTATLARFLGLDGEPIDEGIALLFPGPASYTGETILELHGHGGPTVLRMVLARCLQAGAGLGARIAEPGEFTRRAFLNGRMDLAQAEGVADLIEAGSARAARSAMRSLRGEFSAACGRLAEELTSLRALVEATLDFPEEEIDFLRAADARERLARANAALRDTQDRARRGAVLREGLRVVLVGQPNVGKSSLLNALADEDVALVTEHPGTTRDRIERRIELAGVPLDIVDTAGLRQTEDPVERLGIERTMVAVRDADLILEIVDDAGPLPSPALRAGEGQGERVTVKNKIDLTGSLPGEHDGAIHVSALTGAGLDALRSRLLHIAGWENEAGGEDVFLARERHLHALARAGDHLERATLHADAGSASLELLAEELRLASQALGEISGMPAADDLLGLIFGRFCIGK